MITEVHLIELWNWEDEMKSEENILDFSGQHNKQVPFCKFITSHREGSINHNQSSISWQE